MPTFLLPPRALGFLGLAVLLAALACTRGPSGNPPGLDGAAARAEAEMADPKADKYAASHLLVAHVGSVDAPAGVSRTEEAARTLAFDLWRQIDEGASFEALAAAHSEGPTAPRGGRLGTFRTGTMVADFERAVAALEVGEVGKPLHTPFGWHVIRRDEVVEIELQHILVTWQEAYGSGAIRSRADALVRMDEVKTRLAAGEPFDLVARSLSDDATGARGGFLGVVSRGQLIPAFEDAAFALDVGGISEALETPYGLHIILRSR